VPIRRPKMLSLLENETPYLYSDFAVWAELDVSGSIEDGVKAIAREGPELVDKLPLEQSPKTKNPKSSQALKVK